MTHGPLHSNKCLPNFGVLKLIVGSIKMRYAIFQKQIMNRVHTIFSHWMIKKTDRNHQLDYLSERSYYVIFHNLLKISLFLLSWLYTTFFHTNTCLHVITQPINICPQNVLRKYHLTSPERPLNILFDHPGDVTIWPSEDVPIWRPRDVPNQPPRDVHW